MRPEARVEWFLDYQASEPLAHADGWDDGILRDMTDLVEDEFDLWGRMLRVGWLHGSEAEQRLAAHGW